MSKLTEVEQVEAVVLGATVLGATVVAALLWLDAGKEQHQQAGLHEPTPQAECYELPGQGELATFPNHAFTYCDR